MCFKEKRTAETVIDYVTAFRSNYGYWPSMDMSKPVKVIESKVKFKPRSPYELRKYLTIDTFDYDTIFNMARRTNVSFFCVDNFVHVPNGQHQHYMNLTGQEWDGEADPVEFAQLMEFKYQVED